VKLRIFTNVRYLLVSFTRTCYFRRQYNIYYACVIVYLLMFSLCGRGLSRVCSCRLRQLRLLRTRNATYLTFLRRLHQLHKNTHSVHCVG